jgi:hypothetical protein
VERERAHLPCTSTSGPMAQMPSQRENLY